MNAGRRQWLTCLCTTLTLCGLLHATPAAATHDVAAGQRTPAHSAAGNLSVHGFFTQAALHTSDNSFGGATDDGMSTDYNEAGINVMLEPLQHLRISAQAVARNAGDYDRGELRTDYFQLDYAFINSSTDTAGLRVGRVKNVYGLFNDTRDVAHTRPSIYLPTIIYWEQLRDIMLFRDGGSVYWDHYGSNGMLAIDAGYGKPKVTERLATEVLFTEIAHIDADDPEVMVGRVLWEDANGRLRLALSTLQASSGFDIGIRGNFDAELYLASLQYGTERWQLTSEIAYFIYDLSLDAPALASLLKAYHGDAAYVQYAWFFTPSWQLYARYDVGYFDRNNRSGSSFEPLLPAAIGYTRDAGLGVRWDIDKHWMISVEAHYLEGLFSLSIIDNPALESARAYWTLAGVELAFRF